MSDKSILIVDDELEMRQLIGMYLEEEGFHCIQVKDGQEALSELKNHHFDAVILDVMMPKMDGLTACMKIRETSNIPIIFVTARGDEWDKVHGLRIGADDYIVKPFSPSELVARVYAVLRRTTVTVKEKDDFESYGSLKVDKKGRKVRLNDKELSLTLKEFDLLLCLCDHIGQVLSREQLLELVWGYEYCGSSRTVDTHIKTLRLKFGDEGHILKTIWGIGYKLEV